MFTHQYKNLSRSFLALSKKHGLFFPFTIPNSINTKELAINGLVNRYFFGSKKPRVPQQKSQKQPELESKNTQQSQFLWKLNVVQNLIGIGAGFYFPLDAAIFILTSSSIIQVYESSKLITRFKEMTEKGPKYSQEQIDNVLGDIKKIAKKIVISLGVLLASSLTMGLSFVYPSCIDYSLLLVNFWILLNIKFSNLSHGYYFVLLTLVIFEYLYFQKVFESNKRVWGSQQI